MAIHWQIKFKSLRAGEVYTVSIYDSSYTGSTPVQLKGGAEPFVTQEDDDEDMFTPIRTQSGYLRIVDDGLDANGNAFNWKDLIPATDTSRPVVLTNNAGTVCWQGFMQAQNFGSHLYGNPQEREFPIQCCISSLDGSPVDLGHTSVENFAFLLNDIVNAVDGISGGLIYNHAIVNPGVIHINEICIQGGSDAIGWMRKCVDWQNLMSIEEGDKFPRYNLYDVLADMCAFWGFTARTYKDRLYLLRADDSSHSTFAVLNRTQLSTLASGGSVTPTSASFTTISVLGSEFANTNNEEALQRGHNKATVNSDSNNAEGDHFMELDGTVGDLMLAEGWGDAYTSDDKIVQYTNDLLYIDRPLLSGTARYTYGSFCVGEIGDRAITSTDARKAYNMIRIKKSYNASVAAYQPYVELNTVFEHCYSGGRLRLHGSVYRHYDKYEEEEDRKTMYARLGIGKTRSEAVWFNGSTWSSTETMFKILLGSTDDILHALSQSENFESYTIRTPNAIGKLFFEILGSDDLDDISGEKSFEIADFYIEYYKQKTIVESQGSAFVNWENVNMVSEMSYTSTNSNNVRDEWDCDSIYASDNNMTFGFGLVINSDGTFMEKATYGSGEQYPEQNLADRVTTYWAASKRRIMTELRSPALAEITPMNKVTIDGTTCFPISISRSWRDDISMFTLMQL